MGSLLNTLNKNLKNLNYLISVVSKRAIIWRNIFRLAGTEHLDDIEYLDDNFLKYDIICCKLSETDTLLFNDNIFY